MNIIGWILQVILAVVFFMAGSMKVFRPYEKLITVMHDMADFPPFIVKGIGTLELLAAIGLILPMLTGIFAQLTPLAAIGLILTMIGAAYTHLRKNEYSMIITNIVLLALAAIVVYIRFVAEPV